MAISHHFLSVSDTSLSYRIEALSSSSSRRSLCGSNLLLSSSSRNPSPSRRNLSLNLRCQSKKSRRDFDHIPKQFRGENLKDGLMDNYKNVPRHFPSLSTSQMDIFMKEDHPIWRQSEKVTEENISSASYYRVNPSGGMTSSRGSGRYNEDDDGFDIPSSLLDARIIYLDSPLYPEVTELIVQQFIWLDSHDNSLPVYLYINSTGERDADNKVITSRSAGYAIASCIVACISKVYTINTCMASGQAAMLLSLGTKGFRGVLPYSLTTLCLPSIDKSSGSSTDMWFKAMDLDGDTELYTELVAQGTGKSKEEIATDLQPDKYFRAQEAIDYGLADKILYSPGGLDEGRSHEELLRQANGSGLHL